VFNEQEQRGDCGLGNFEGFEQPYRRLSPTSLFEDSPALAPALVLSLPLPADDGSASILDDVVRIDALLADRCNRLATPADHFAVPAPTRARPVALMLKRRR
jgi:hypothetical protein